MPEIMEGKYDEKKGNDLLEIACVTNEEILYLLDSGDQVELWSIPLTQKDSTDEVQIEEKKFIFHTQNMIDILYTDKDYIAYKELSAYTEFDRTKQKKMVINADHKETKIYYTGLINNWRNEKQSWDIWCYDCTANKSYCMVPENESADLQIEKAEKMNQHNVTDV